MSKFPIGGLSLNSQIKWGNAPEIVFIYVGGEDQGKSLTPGIANLSLHYDQQPGASTWPVSGLLCLIIWDIGPSAEQVKAVYDALMLSGAAAVEIISKQIDYERPGTMFDIALQKWIETESDGDDFELVESIKINNPDIISGHEYLIFYKKNDELKYCQAVYIKEKSAEIFGQHIFDQLEHDPVTDKYYARAGWYQLFEKFGEYTAHRINYDVMRWAEIPEIK